MPKDSKTGKALVPKASKQPPVHEGKVAKPRKTPLQASASTGSHDVPVKEFEERRRQMQDQLHQVEIQIFKLETQYVEKANPRGNALKGYEGLLSSVASTVNKSAIRPEDRIFSNSSVTGSLA